MTAHERFIHALIAQVRSGEVWLPWSAWYLQEAIGHVDVGAWIDALDWHATVEQYDDPDHDDGDTPPFGDRREINRLRREEAQRQLYVAVARLLEPAGVCAA